MSEKMVIAGPFCQRRLCGHVLDALAAQPEASAFSEMISPATGVSRAFSA
jgi:hypothetical protein